MSALLGQRPAQVRPPRTRTPEPLFLALLVAVCLASVVVVVVLGSRLSFFNDDWYLLLQRPGLESHGGLDVLFAPHNSNLVFIPVLAIKAVVAVFGLGSQVPYRILLGMTIAAVGIFLFLLVSERVGALAGLASAAVVVFLGAAWEDLLFITTISPVGSVATGLASIWALERETPRADAVACLLLLCSVGFSNVGVPFAVAAGVAILLRGRPARLWVAAVPLVLFGLWWVLEGSSEPSHLSASNVQHLPRYVLDSASAGLASVTGLNQGTVPGTYTRGRVLLALAAVVAAAAVVRGRRPPVTVLVPVAAALTFWILTGAGFTPGREPFASRYQLIDAVLLLWTAAELLRGLRVGRAAGAILVAVTIAVVWSNVENRLSDGYRFMRAQSAYARADLGALELGRRFAPKSLWLVDAVAHNPYLSGVTAGRFLAETGAHGRVPTYDARQIASSPGPQRQAADSVLAFAERLPPTRTRQERLPTKGCTRLRTNRAGLSPEADLAPGNWLLADDAKTGFGIGVRRFAPSGLPVYIGLIEPGWAERLAIPRDGLALPWRLSVKAPARSPSATVAVCRR